MGMFGSMFADRAYTVRGRRESLKLLFDRQLGSVPMNTLVLRFDQATGNKYEFEVHCQDAYQVKADGNLHNQRQAPTNVGLDAHYSMVTAGQASDADPGDFDMTLDRPSAQA